MPTGAETDRGKGIPSRRAPCLIESGLTRRKCEAGDRRSGGTVTLSNLTASFANLEAAEASACVALASSASVSSVMKFCPTQLARLASRLSLLKVSSTLSRKDFASAAVGAAVDVELHPAAIAADSTRARKTR